MTLLLITDVAAAFFLAPRGARSVDIIAKVISQPLLIDRIRQYLYNYTSHERLQSSQDIPLADCPHLDNHDIYTYPSAQAVFFAPSDILGLEGMKTERIRSVSNWQGTEPRYDCILVGGEEDVPGFRGCIVARVFLTPLPWCNGIPRSASNLVPTQACGLFSLILYEGDHRLM
jgi:hypothetical protein